MGSFLSSNNFSKEDIQMALDKVKQIVSSTPVVVFSKTYCVYCNRVKQLLTQLGASYKTIELDEESDGGEMQAALIEWTGQTTVPNVFIGETHIGGCDSVVAKHQAGQLAALLANAGAITVNLNA
ncbi:Glutaredoxin [Hibiscus syriacus]|uniref:Glutaredoxin n=1 Tax=Hibiscus syriacus TaxID=106335 RepID=A0A6A3B3F0_HIBSY|nr:glutaredoxin-like [Hibiscus syriacus]KAE8709629.1 Glutaredoxin [Hibiscus syriacus]